MTERNGLAMRVLGGAVAALAVIGMAAGGAQAQAKPKTPPKKAQSAWVKLCETATLPRPGKGGKTETVKRDICLTHHERLDGNTGMVIISAAIRVVNGQEKPHLMIMVPLGMALPPGVKAAVYSKEQWERARNRKKVDDKELKPIALKYSLCHPAGCTAEITAPDGLVKAMETGGGLMILALNAAGRPIAFPVPLTGFAAAHKGKPIDSRKYGEARQRLMASIRERLRKRIADQQARAAAAARTPKPEPVKK
ncbi:MAG: invasion associated locus B family protein [Hyphomicrobiaceae bacterium]|nr:invasion associated locus B family protein [Hyphomicrobiaceae bacterium]